MWLVKKQLRWSMARHNPWRTLCHSKAGGFIFVGKGIKETPVRAKSVAQATKFLKMYSKGDNGRFFYKIVAE